MLTLSAQSGWSQKIISGSIVDGNSKENLYDVSVLLKDPVSGEIINGAKTNERGYFELSSGLNLISLEIRNIGYETKFIDSLTLDKDSIRLGQISIALIDQALEEIVVLREKSTTEFRLDKRVFNVGKDISSSGASALEVLNHVPSVTVNIEGVISLRGSSGVQILIDGKPSVMSDDPSKALGTITADMIDRIEVITNPSAKYEAEGTSGIINIVLKKDQKKGLNGSISLNVGWPHNHSLGFSLNYRSEKFNIFTQIGAGYRSLPRYNNSINRDLFDSVEIISDGIYYRNEAFANITLGSDFYVNRYNTITLSGNYAYEAEQQPSMTSFYQGVVNGDTIMTWDRSEVTEAGNPKYQFDLQYKKEFKDTSAHTLTFSTQGKFFGKSQNSEFLNIMTFGVLDSSYQRTMTTFQQADYIGKLDYFKPFKKYFSIEAGSQYEMNDVGNDYQVDNKVNESWIVDSSYTNNFIYKQSVLGVYTTGAFEKKKWGVKLGVRVENTDLYTELVTTNDKKHLNYTNLFPTLHSSYKLSKKIQLQLGYSRRVSRPRLWNLNPFFNISNNFNIRRGNPELLPEFTDSYEATSIYELGKFNMNLGVYYRYTTQTIETVSIFENNVNTTLPMNIGTNDLLGLEWNSKWDATSWLTVTGDLNFNYFKRQGDFNGQNFDFEGNKYTGKLMTKIKASKILDVELTGNYESGYKTIQGEQLYQMYLNAGVRLKVWKGRGVINFSVRDVFVTRIDRVIVDQPDYYLYRESTRGRVMTLGFSYGFGKGEAMSYSGGGHYH